ncbi:hypothetical protein GBF38_009435, partial [Nibea albiflora]
MTRRKLHYFITAFLFVFVDMIQTRRDTALSHSYTPSYRLTREDQASGRRRVFKESEENQTSVLQVFGSSGNLFVPQEVWTTGKKKKKKNKEEKKKKEKKERREEEERREDRRKKKKKKVYGLGVGMKDSSDLPLTRRPNIIRHNEHAAPRVETRRPAYVTQPGGDGSKMTVILWVVAPLKYCHRDYDQVLDSLRGRHRDYVQVLDSLRGRHRDYVQVLDSLRGRHRDYVQVLDSLLGRHRDYVQVLDSLQGRHRDYVQVLDSLLGRHRDYVQVLDSLLGRHRDYVQV